MQEKQRRLLRVLRCCIPHRGTVSRIGVPHPAPEHPPGSEELLGQAAPRRAAAEGHKLPWWPLDYFFFWQGLFLVRSEGFQLFFFHAPR